jgi:hypothetical protein
VSQPCPSWLKLAARITADISIATLRSGPPAPPTARPGRRDRMKFVDTTKLDSKSGVTQFSSPLPRQPRISCYAALTNARVCGFQ